jgi:hypothetical protein
VKILYYLSQLTNGPDLVPPVSTNDVAHKEAQARPLTARHYFADHDLSLLQYQIQHSLKRLLIQARFSANYLEPPPNLFI